MPKYISDKWASRLHILEITWSYMLPCVLITILDVKVLCFQNKIAAPLRSSASFNTSPQFEIRMRSASECIIKPTTTNEMSSTGSPQSTPPISYKEDKKLIKQRVSFKENVSVTYNVAIPIRISTSVSSYKEMSMLENPGYQEEQKEEPIRKQSYLKNENWLGIRRTNSFELLNLMPRKHSKRTYNQVRVLRRCLFITLLDLSMNLPNYLFRLYLNMISQEEFEKLLSQNYTWIFNCIEDLSQLLYFAQFSLNALYLVYLVYDPPKKNQIV
uniref:Uncharacterized protein n=1 Tax=Acrobeloides nanus TaxID=290746 RepID=A0A914BWC0_9BILA